MPEFRLSRLLPTVAVGVLGATALYSMFRVFEGGVGFRPFLALGLFVIVLGGVGPVQLGIIFTMHSVERRNARRRFHEGVCVWCGYDLGLHPARHAADAAPGDTASDPGAIGSDEAVLTSPPPGDPAAAEARCPECGSPIATSIGRMERVTNRRLVQAAAISILSVLAGCAAAEGWLLADTAAFRSEAEASAQAGNPGAYRRPRRWPNGWMWLVHDAETNEVRSVPPR